MSSSAASAPQLTWKQIWDQKELEKKERSTHESVGEACSKAFADSNDSHREDLPLISVYDQSGKPTSLFLATDSQSLGVPIILANVPESSSLRKKLGREWGRGFASRPRIEETPPATSSSASATSIPPKLVALIKNVASIGTNAGELWGPLGAIILSYLPVNPFSSNLQSPKNVPPGSPTVVSKVDFLANFRRLTGGVFDAFTPSDWSGIVVAGGVIQCALDASVSHSPNATGSKLFSSAPRYNSSLPLETSPNSDVDVWLYGLTEAQAREKILRLFTVLSAAATSTAYQWEGFSALEKAKLHQSLALASNRPLAIRTPSKYFWSL